MSRRSDRVLLSDMLEAARRIAAYTKNVTYRKFSADLKTQDAVVRNLEIIGEAGKGLSPALRKCHGDIPWKSIIGMRDRLIHDYSGVNIDIVWQVATVDLSVFAARLESLLKTIP